MAKKLVIVRHGQASHDLDAGDFNRKLTDLGKSQNEEVANKILQHNCIPDLLISSNANRAFITAKIFAKTWGIDDKKIVINPSIYEATLNKLLNLVNEIENKFNHVAIFGHNPGLSELAEYLTGLNFQLSTSALIILEFDVDNWMEITRNSGKFSLYLEPSDF